MSPCMFKKQTKNTYTVTAQQQAQVAGARLPLLAFVFFATFAFIFSTLAFVFSATFAFIFARAGSAVLGS